MGLVSSYDDFVVVYRHGLVVSVEDRLMGHVSIGAHLLCFFQILSDVF